MMNNIDSDWVLLGLKAEEYIKSGDINLAKICLFKSIKLKPDKAWPYLLLSSIIEDNDMSISLIRATKNIELTEWYYIGLIEKYATQIKILKKDFLEKYNPSNLTEDSAVIHWRQISELVHSFPTNNISINDLKKIDNKWECIAILCTGKEYLDNIYLKFLHNIYNTLDKNIAKNLHLKLIIKSSDCHKYSIPSLFNNIFASIGIETIDLIDELDIYDDKHNILYNSNIIKQYGSKYGPNFVFFETMHRLNSYNTSLLLECDCILYPNWMKRINNYIDAQNLLISGSQSDSPNDEKFDNIRNRHINGGTAIYATGNSLFQKFLKLCEDAWPIYIQNKSIDLPYDYLLLMTIEHYFNNAISKKDKIVWSYIKKHYVYNTLVANWSDTTYTDYPPQTIYSQAQPAILHQKPPHYPGVLYS